MKIISTKEWLAAKPEDRKAIIEKAPHKDTIDMKVVQAFMIAFEEQQKLSKIEQDDSMYITKYQQLESMLKKSAKEIKTKNWTGRVIGLFPKYKDALLFHIDLVETT